ncbi:hypothetical protein JTB14_023877, partial [Gonioctena quinquepunctata]
NRLMVNYYNFKESAREYFEIDDIHHIKELSKTLTVSIPPHYDQLGRRMLIMKIGKYISPSKQNETFQK